MSEFPENINDDTKTWHEIATDGSGDFRGSGLEDAEQVHELAHSAVEAAHEQLPDGHKDRTAIATAKVTFSMWLGRR
jgi:hypothetical protein